ncbi:Thioredoxin reductase 2 [Chlorella vulgaris]
MTVEQLRTKVCIVGSGPAGHTAAIYAARAELHPVMLEGWMANGIAAGGQLTTTHEVENFPGFPEGILGGEICERFRAQSLRFGTKIFSETVTKIDLSSRPFHIYTDEKEVVADTVIVATGAVARRLPFPGSDEDTGFWNKGISACAVCDGAAPMFRNQPIAVIGGGDSACEEGQFLTKYGSKVYIIHRRDELRASKIMQARVQHAAAAAMLHPFGREGCWVAKRVLEHPKIEMVWDSVVEEAYPNAKGTLGGVRLKNLKTGELRDLPLAGLFFAIGHEPATAFLDGQLELDEDKYVVTAADSTATNVPGVFAAGDVQDKRYRQAVTAAGSGCMAALEVERFLEEQGQA